ncbi:MAG: type I glutamate--ammonia ligase [Candidatus Muirbacterium halophilum]|nr:type I glutamate--ammonia ligase [Candidatus Muirbacterium halophilum]MCK9477124.1 type I glutamate--ammonia ligase [Candidatus Muirbacterium halophilum]
MEKIKKMIIDKKIDLVDLKITDFVGRMHHITVPAKNFNEFLMEDGIGFDASNYKFAKVENSDMVLKPDLSSGFVDEFYSDRVLSFLCDSYIADSGLKNNLDPRNICKNVIELFKKKNIADDIMLGPEFEFHIFDDVKYEYSSERAFFEVFSKQSKKNSGNSFSNKGYHLSSHDGYHASLPNDTFADIRNKMTIALEEMGIPIKYNHHEVGGAGQMEIETDFMGFLEAADNTQIIKYVIKNIAKREGKTATFMPKPIENEAGNGFHVHMFPVKDGKNIFVDQNGVFNEIFYYAIGGILKNVKSLVAITNPSTNSYKRLIPGFEAPVKIFFGKANRSATIRVPAYVKKPEKMRFEYRTMDAMCNPYMAFSAIAMAMYDGIVNKIDARECGFGPYDINIFALPEEDIKNIDSLPTNFDAALKHLKEDNSFLTKENIFSKVIIDKFLDIKYKEIMEVNKKITPYEYVTYYDF